MTTRGVVAEVFFKAVTFRYILCNTPDSGDTYQHTKTVYSYFTSIPWEIIFVHRSIVTFGEIMGRVNTVGFRRLAQSLPGNVEMMFAGAEANVAVSICQLGGMARFVSALPDHAVADACLKSLNAFGIDTQYVVRGGEGRLGMYFIEGGVNQRPSNIVYDRDGSTISLTPAIAYDWSSALANATWLHVTGITPAISSTAAQATLEAVQAAEQLGLTVSCDLNFRKKLWRWRPEVEPAKLAQQTMREILQHVEIVIANEEDAAVVLDIHAGDSDVESGKLAIDKYPTVAREIVRQFSHVTRVAITLRESISASHNRWGAMLYDARQDQACFAPLNDGQYCPYEITNIVDRVGAGDSFAAGLIYASCTSGLDVPTDTLAFATASSCLAHSVPGDFNYATREEVEALMHGSGSGRVVR